MPIKEALLYLFVGLSSILLVSYLPHMFVGGVVSAELEMQLTIGVAILWTLVIAALGWDIVRRRRNGG